MIKKLVIVLMAIMAFQSQGQEGMASPYSFYGIGSLKFKGTVENRSMGGLSVFMDSIHVNLRNPASYVGPDLNSTPYNGESRPVKFAIGGSHNSTKLKSDTGSDRTSTATFDYFAVSIPMNRFGFGFGILPYTSVGYKLESFNSAGSRSNRYKGEGGTNKVFLGVGYKITDELSIGIDAHYNFGNIQNSSIAFVYDDEGELVEYQSREDNRSDLSGLNLNFGMSYKTMLNDKLQLMSSFTYAPKSSLKSSNERSISTVLFNEASGRDFIVNTIEIDLDANGLKKTDLTMPARVSFGAGVGAPKKWFVGTEFTFQNTSKFSNPLYEFSNAEFVNASNISIGGFYIPDYDSFSKYWKRVVYRAGLHFENTGLEINNETVKEFGMSFGLGLPIGGLFSNGNIGLEIGKRGTQNQSLVQENFINLQFSLSLNQRWFEKRKYD